MKYLLELAIIVGVASSCSENQSKPRSESSVAASGEIALPSDILRYLPSDTPIVVGVRVTNLFESSFGMTMVQESLNGKKGEKFRSELKEKCGIDAWTVAKDLIIVPGQGKDFLNRKELVFGLSSNLDQKAFEECVVSMGGTVGDGMYSGKKQSFHAYWPAPGIAFFSTEKTSKELQSWAAEGNGLGNETLLSLIGEIDNKASIWAAGVIPEPVLEVLTDLDQSPLSGHFGVIFDKDVHVALSMNFDTEADAKGMSSYLKKLMLMMKGESEVQKLIQNADVTQSGKTTRIELDLDSKTIGEGIRKRRESDD